MWGGVYLGAPAGTRTPDTLLKRQVLYLLSYWGEDGFSASPSQLEAQRSGFELEKEEGTYGYAVFAALTQTAETEWSKFLLTWLGWRDSNPLYRSQSPVCYHYTTSQSQCKKGGGRRPPAFHVGWDMGLEPTTPGTTIRCSTN